MLEKSNKKNLKKKNTAKLHTFKKWPIDINYGQFSTPSALYSSTSRRFVPSSSTYRYEKITLPYYSHINFFLVYISCDCCKRMRRRRCVSSRSLRPLPHHQRSRSFRLGYEIFSTPTGSPCRPISHLVLWRWLSLDRIVLVLFILVSSRRRRLYMCGRITSFIYTYQFLFFFFVPLCSP